MPIQPPVWKGSDPNWFGGDVGARDQGVRARNRDLEVRDQLDRLQTAKQETPAHMLVQTAVAPGGVYPTVAQAEYYCLPAASTNLISEGTALTAVLGSVGFLAINVGSAIPPMGTFRVATLAGTKHTIQYDG